MTDSEQESCLLCNRDSSVEGDDHPEDNCQLWIFAPRSAKEESGLLVSTDIFLLSAGAVTLDRQQSSLLT